MNIIEFKNKYERESSRINVFDYELFRVDIEKLCIENKAEELTSLYNCYCLYGSVNEDDGSTFSSWKNMFFHYACMCANPTIVEALLEAGDVDPKEYLDGIYTSSIREKTDNLLFLFENINKYLSKYIVKSNVKEEEKYGLILQNKKFKTISEIKHPTGLTPNTDFKTIIPELFKQFTPQVDLIDQIGESNNIKVYKILTEQMRFKCNFDKKSLNKLAKNGATEVIYFLEEKGFINLQNKIHLILNIDNNKLLDSKYKKYIEHLYGLSPPQSNFIRKELTSSHKSDKSEKMVNIFNSLIEKISLNESVTNTAKVKKVKLL